MESCPSTHQLDNHSLGHIPLDVFMHPLWECEWWNPINSFHLCISLQKSELLSNLAFSMGSISHKLVLPWPLLFLRIVHLHPILVNNQIVQIRWIRWSPTNLLSERPKLSFSWDVIQAEFLDDGNWSMHHNTLDYCQYNLILIYP